MDEPQVESTFKGLDSGRWIKPNRIRTLAGLSQIYEQEGVLTDDRALALHRACPDATACWDGATNRASCDAETPAWSGDEDGSIFWPWVGESYRPGGVCIVAFNINHGGQWWSITDEYAIAAAQTPHLSAGRKRMPGGSELAYRSGSSAMAILASREGSTPEESPDPRGVPAAMEEVVKLQAVKCSPLGSKSKPTPRMCSNCPPRFLRRELEVLRPGVVISLGTAARGGVERSGQVTWSEHIRGYGRGKIEFASGRISSAFSLYHPSARAWPTSQRALIASLNETPVN